MSSRTLHASPPPRRHDTHRSLHSSFQSPHPPPQSPRFVSTPRQQPQPVPHHTPMSAGPVYAVNKSTGPPPPEERPPLNVVALIAVFLNFICLILIIVALATEGWLCSPAVGDADRNAVWNYGLLAASKSSGGSVVYSDNKSGVLWRAGTAIFVIMIFGAIFTLASIGFGIIYALGGSDLMVILAICLSLSVWIFCAISVSVWAGEVWTAIFENVPNWPGEKVYSFSWNMTVAAAVLMLIAAILYIVARALRPAQAEPEIAVVAPPPPPPVEFEEVRVARDIRPAARWRDQRDVDYSSYYYSSSSDSSLGPPPPPPPRFVSRGPPPQPQGRIVYTSGPPVHHSGPPTRSRMRSVSPPPPRGSPPPRRYSRGPGGR